MTDVLDFLIILDLSDYFESFLMALPPNLSLCFPWLLIRSSCPFYFFLYNSDSLLTLFSPENAFLRPVLVVEGRNLLHHRCSSLACVRERPAPVIVPIPESSSVSYKENSNSRCLPADQLMSL